MLNTVVKTRSGRKQGCRETLTGMEDDCYLRRMIDKGQEGRLESWDPPPIMTSLVLSLYLL